MYNFFHVESIIFYYLIILLTFGFACWYEYTKRQKAVLVFEYGPFSWQSGNVRGFIPFLLVLLVPILVSSMRYHVGRDYFNYLRMYDRVVKEIGKPAFWDFSENEPGFKALIVLCRFIFNDRQSIIYVSAIIGIFIAFLAYLRNRSGNFALAVLGYMTYIYFPMMNTIRMGISVAVVLFSYEYIAQKKFWKFLIGVLIATSFHYSAIIVLPCYFFSNSLFKASAGLTKFKRILYYVALIVVITNIALIMNIFGETKYEHYISETYGGFKLPSPFSLAFWVIAIVFRKDFIAIDKRNRIYADLVILEIFFTFLSYRVSIVDRVLFYFVVAKIALFSSLYKVLGKYHLQILILLLLFIYLRYPYNVFFSQKVMMVPYTTTFGWRPFGYL